MTDNTQSLPIDLLSSSIGNSSATGSLFTEFSSGASQDKSFSRELSRASKRMQSDSSEQAQADRDMQRSRESTTTRSDNVSRNQEGRSSETVDSANDRSDVSSSHNSRKPTRSDDDSVTSTKDAGNKSKENVDTDATTANSDTQGSNKVELHQNEGNQTEETASGVIDADDPVSVGTVVNLDGSESELLRATVATNERGLASSILDGADQVESAETSQAKPGSKRLATAGSASEYLLSSAQLASRQSHLVSQSVQTSVSSEAASSVKGSATAATGQATLPLTTALPGSFIAGSLGVAENRRQVDANKVAPKLDTDVVQRVSNLLASDRQVRQSASELVPQTDTIEDVQRYQNQVMESNLAEKQLLKQMQSKVQAEIQAHVQSQQASTQTNLVSGSRVITDAGSNIPDNMFLTTASGIVTAPVQARSDAASAQVTNAPLTLPLLQSDADKTMSSNIRWMVNEGVKNAVVNVTPSGMGPISVSVGIENDHMSVSIVALQGSTREALDSMLPRLREQLAMQGHDSVKVDISNGGSENSDRGFGRSDSGDSQGTDHQSDAPAELTGITLDSLGADNEEENVDELKQGSLAVDKHGQISSHYDVYV